MKEEIILDEKKVTITTKLPKEALADNNLKILLDETIDLKNVVKEINSNDKK